MYKRLFFKKYAAQVWTDTEREAFISWLTSHPEAGDVIPKSGSLRKVRWSKKGIGKRGAQESFILIVLIMARFGC